MCPSRAMGKSESSKDDQTPTALVTAVRRVLRPLVGFLLDHGLNYTWLTGQLKGLFVEVAEREFGLPGKAQTDSRITLLTGVHRKDVRRLRRAPPDNEAPPASVFLGAQLVALWLGDDRFVNAEGRPRALSRRSEPNEDPSFEDLVTTVSTDIRPRAVLDEWLRLGTVEIDSEDRVRLKAEAFVPAKGFDEKAFYFGRNVHDHLAAARHNLGDRGPPFLERSVYYDDLSEKSVRTLATLAEEEAMKAIKVINRRAKQLQTRDRGKPGSDLRMNFGVYFYYPGQNEPDPDNED